jgi:hypothetical protein
MIFKIKYFIIFFVLLGLGLGLYFMLKNKDCNSNCQINEKCVKRKCIPDCDSISCSENTVCNKSTGKCDCSPECSENTVCNKSTGECECSPECSENTVCNKLTGKCDCRPGWSGKDCKTCLFSCECGDINKCGIICQSKCQNEGNGQICVTEINECATSLVIDKTYMFRDKNDDDMGISLDIDGDDPAILVLGKDHLVFTATKCLSKSTSFICLTIDLIILDYQSIWYMTFSNRNDPSIPSVISITPFDRIKGNYVKWLVTSSGYLIGQHKDDNYLYIVIKSNDNRILVRRTDSIQDEDVFINFNINNTNV